MHLSTPVLYELVFGGAMLLMAAMSLVVILGLRLLLRSWESRWLKTVLVHAVNLPVLVMGFPLLVGYLPLSHFLWISNGGVLCFGLACLVGDVVRVAISGPARGGHRRGIAIMLIAGAVGLVCTRGTAYSDAGKRGLDDARLRTTVVKVLQARSPEREILTAMHATFPEELEGILQRCMARVRVEEARSPEVRTMPGFPYGEVARLIARHRADIGRAPDAALSDLAGTLPAQAAFIERSGARCGGVSASGLVIEEPLVSQPAGEADARAMGLHMAAALRAARAGIDRPVERDFSGEQLDQIRSRLAEVAPNEVDPTSCKPVTARMRWIGELPTSDAAYVLAAFYDPRAAAR